MKLAVIFANDRNYLLVDDDVDVDSGGSEPVVRMKTALFQTALAGWYLMTFFACRATSSMSMDKAMPCMVGILKKMIPPDWLNTIW